MTEYNVNFLATPEGPIAVDIHGSAGTAPYLRFPSKNEVYRFFESIGVTGDKLGEVESICSNLPAGHSFHEKMFLPDQVDMVVRKITGQQPDDGAV